MLSSTFHYEEISEKGHPLGCFYDGNYYKNARRENVGNDEEELKHRCVIMKYHDYELAMAQIKLSCRMKYALKVLHITNTGLPTKVIYPFFKKTMSQWLNDVRAPNYQLPENMGDGEWMKTEVIPKIRELWRLLHEMKERNMQICKERNHDQNNTDPGHYMPLIEKESKLLKLRGGAFVSGEVMLLPRVLRLKSREGNDHDNDKNYAKDVFDAVLTKDRACDLPKKFEIASDFWNAEITKEEITSSNYWFCSKHPILYDPADKERFLLLINNIVSRYGLKGWLNGEKEAYKWIHFLSDIKSAKDENRNVYQQILKYKAGGSASKKGKLEEPLSYSAGSDIVRFTRNALMHFEENYKRGHNITWHRGLDDHEREIVEILDDELNVCSIHYDIAKTIIAGDPPKKYTEEGWNNFQAKEWINLKQKHPVAVIRQAYQPAQLEVRDSSNNWMAATEFIRLYQPLSLLQKNQPDCWMKATDIKKKHQVKDPELDELEFLAKEDLKLDWMKFKDIKEKYNYSQRLELLTNVSSWMEVKEVFQHLQSQRLLVEKGCHWMEEATDTSEHPERDMDSNYWMEATDILTDPKPPRLCTKEGWKLSWMELEEIKNKTKQPLKFFIKEDSGEKFIKKKDSGKVVWKELEIIEEEVNQQLNFLTRVSSWMKATKAFAVDQPQLMSLWKREDSREDNWKKLKEIEKEANKQIELLTRLSSWMKTSEIVVCQLPMDLWTKDGWKMLEEIKNEANQQELWTKDGWKILEIKNDTNQQLELWTRVSSWMKVEKVREIQNNPDQQLELWTMKEAWKQAEEIIKDDQPPSLRVEKGEDKYWMEAFEANRPAAEFLTKKNWLNARAELKNFYNSLK